MSNTGVAANIHLDERGDVVELRGGTVARELRWGEQWQVGSAAYWTALTSALRAPCTHAIGKDLREEVAACILGGYGIPANVGLAAFSAVRDAGLIESGASPEDFERVLSTPLPVGGRLVRYRFGHQRSARLAEALRMLAVSDPPSEPRDLRDWLLSLPGVGLKTASWIVRNFFGCDQIAIIDVHVWRAGVAAAVFDPAWTPSMHYQLLEQMFCAWASRGGVSAADLDAVIWSQMASFGRRMPAILGWRPGVPSRYLP